MPVFMLLGVSIGIAALSVPAQASANVPLTIEDSPALFSLLGEDLEAGLENTNPKLVKPLVLQSALKKLFALTPSKKRRKKAIFDIRLRQDIRASLRSLALIQPEQVEPLVASDTLLEVVLSWNDEQLAERASQRLQVLDKGLSAYLRISQNKSAFEQLVDYVPALYNLEERKMLLQLLKSNKLPQPSLKNKRLAEFLDKRISRLAKSLIFNMKALVRERRRYEPDLIKAMQSEGIRFSAKPPDFVLDYALYSDGQDEESNAWLYEGSISLLGKYGIPIVSIDLTIEETVKDEEQAEALALAKMSTALSQNLRAFLLKKR
ncbi:MAG: hypothetical protein GXO35_03775 [Gammaproteobacteria bacterium]|nr:hypothetical protein [Gammaproteobacteria bacterium]